MRVIDYRTTFALHRARAGRGVPPIIAKAVHVDHPDGDIYAWNGFVPFTYDGNTYEGRGLVGQITGIRQTDELQVIESTLSLSGIPSDVADKINDDVTGRTATVYRMILSPELEVIGTPMVLAEIELDRSTYDFDPDGTCTYSLIGYTGFYFLSGTPGSSWSTEDQNLVYDDGSDTGFDRVPEQPTKSLPWGY